MVLFKDNLVKNELAVILSNFQCIAGTIIQLEKSGADLSESFALVQNVENELSEGIQFAKLKLLFKMIE